MNIVVGHRCKTGGLLALLAALFVAWAAAPLSADEAKKEKETRLAEIRIRGSLPESPSQPGLFGELETDLAKVVTLIDRAAKDDALSGIVLRLDDPAIGMGKVAEVRAAVQRARAAGKPPRPTEPNETSAFALRASSTRSFRPMRASR